MHYPSHPLIQREPLSRHLEESQGWSFLTIHIILETRHTFQDDHEEAFVRMEGKQKCLPSTVHQPRQDVGIEPHCFSRVYSFEQGVELASELV